MCFIDYEGPRFYEMSWRKARKEHRCCECGETILPGTSYEYVAGYWDDFGTYKTCDRCVQVRELIKDFEMASGCDEDESFCPHRHIGQTLVDHGLTFASVFEPGAQERYLGDTLPAKLVKPPSLNGALM